MKRSVRECTDIRELATNLGSEVPTALAVLPNNILTAGGKSDLLYASSMGPKISAEWRAKGLPVTPLEHEDEQLPFAFKKSALLDSQALQFVMFVSQQLFVEHPDLLKQALEIACRALKNLLALASTDHASQAAKQPSASLCFLIDLPERGSLYATMDGLEPTELDPELIVRELGTIFKNEPSASSPPSDE